LLGDHRQALDLLLHLLKGDRLIRHDGAIEAAGILLGKNPLGISMYRNTARPTVATATMSAISERSSTQARLFS
jgi:hypothetical protein